MRCLELSDTEESSDPRQTTLMDEFQRATKSPEHADSMVALIGSTALNRMEKDDAETRATKMHRCERMQLSLYKLLEYWAAEEANDCPALAACKIIDIYINVKHRRRDTATAKRELPVIMIGNWLRARRGTVERELGKPPKSTLWTMPLSPSLKNSERSQRRRSRSSPRIHLRTASRRFDLLQMTQYRE